MFAWNTQGLSGSHTLVAKAYDSAGDTGVLAGDTVTVLAPATTPSTVTPDTTPPTVAIVSAVLGSTSLAVTVSASDRSDAVVRVELYADGALAATDTVSPWTFKLNTRSWKLGQHTLQARAYDAAGNVGVSALMTVGP
jgi:Big-like domain-containing protein